MILSFTDDGGQEFSIHDQETGNGIGTVNVQIAGDKRVYTIYIWDELLEFSLEETRLTEH